MKRSISTLLISLVAAVGAHARAGPDKPATLPVPDSSAYKSVTDGIAALNDPKVKQQFASVGLEVVGNTSAQFAAFQAQEFARWKKVIETGKIAAD